MTAGLFFRDKLPHLLGAACGLAFSAVLLAVLGVPAPAILFLCLVLALGFFLPLGGEFLQKRAFYGNAMGILERLEEKYLLPEFLEAPSFSEGALFHEAVRQTAKAMNDAVADARRDMGEYREYIETWVHEIKLPIASSRLALENAPGPLSQRLERDLFQIDGYVEQALFYARSGTVERDYLVRELPLREAAAATVKKYARPLIDAGFRIRMDGLDGVVYSDPKWVEFILGQLVSNAVKYRGADPCLTFSQQVGEQQVALVVADNGVGIPPEDLPRVCDKGFTGANGRGLSTRSTGLGLYLCRKLCGRLGLALSLASRPGEGTRVSITFPKGRFHLLADR